MIVDSIALFNSVNFCIMYSELLLLVICTFMIFSLCMNELFFFIARNRFIKIRRLWEMQAGRQGGSALTWKYFLLFSDLSFHFLGDDLWSTKLLNLNKSVLSIFPFTAYCFCFWCHIWEITAKSKITNNYPCVFSRILQFQLLHISLMSHLN